MKSEVQMKLDFDAIMERYQHYAYFGNFALVMPDCISDQKKPLSFNFPIVGQFRI